MGRRPAAVLTEPAPGIYFVRGPASNWIILRRESRFTLVDGGYRGDVPLVLASLREAGLRADHADAVLVTHAHVDHTGAAAHFSRTYGTPVYAAREELPYLRGVRKHPVPLRQVALRIWQPLVFSWVRQVVSAGGVRGLTVPAARAVDAGLLADLPGAPVAVPTGGHTPGHCAYYLPGHAAVLTGDALVTGHNISRRQGPQLLHPLFTTNQAAARRALEVLGRLDAGLILPGHGPALRMPVALAAAEAAAAADNYSG